MQTTVQGFGFRGITPLMENQVDKKKENELETVLRHVFFEQQLDGLLDLREAP